MGRLANSLLLLGSLACLTAAQAAGDDTVRDTGDAAAAQTPESGQVPKAVPDESEPPDKRLTVEEVLVVTASRTEQDLQHAPAAMTVLTQEEIELSPADDFGDLLRNVPGLNVSQMSARDIQITGRQATSSLASNGLLLLDGRTLYLDFLGFVIWDFLPTAPKEIKQVEVVRGPGSAVWGANAMTGVVNVITKAPKEMAGTSVVLGGGELGTGHANVSHAGVRGKLGYKLAASYYEQDPYERPSGLIPGTMTLYPSFENEGTAQPKVDLRLDYDATDETTWSFSGGLAGTDGIIHSGIGPFDIKPGSALSYFKTNWVNRAMQVTVFANFLDGEANNLLSLGTGGLPLRLDFKSETLNADFGNTSILGPSHVLTYGANVRRSEFDLSIAPRGKNRDELGAFVQDEILFGKRLRWIVGARWDDIDPIGSVFSPRTSLLLSPTPSHTLRVSFNRAFRSPSLIESFLDITLFNRLEFPALPALGLPDAVTYLLPTQVVGYEGLEEEKLDAWEVGYIASLGPRKTLTLSLYRNELKGGTDFFPATFYRSQNPPAGWPLPAFILDLEVFGQSICMAAPALPCEGLPETFSYQNLSEIINRGAEASWNMRLSPAWSWFANYSYQEEPDPSAGRNRPPRHRANLGATYNGRRFFASGNLNHADESFWTDVLSFTGSTDAYTMVNLNLGVHLAGERATFSVMAQNLFDEAVQQHLFGDLIGRKVVGQLRFEF